MYIYDVVSVCVCRGRERERETHTHSYIMFVRRLRPATPSTLVLPALQEHQLQATSAQTRKPCVCAAAVCILVLLLPRSCSRPCSQPPKKTKCREVLPFKDHTSATSLRLPLRILCCCSALGRHPAPRTRLCAAKTRQAFEDSHRGPYQQAQYCPLRHTRGWRAARPRASSPGTRQQKTRCCSCRRFTTHTGRRCASF